MRCLIALWFAAAAAKQSTTEWLRDAAGEDWDAITSDPFVLELAAGTLPNATLARYLVQDYKFIDLFSLLLAAAIGEMAEADKKPGLDFLDIIQGPENTYFQRAMHELGLTQADLDVKAEPETEVFMHLMRRATLSEKLHVMLAVLVVCEWSYLTWGSSVTPAHNLSWLHLEWIDLHRGAYFESVVAYLRGALDKMQLSEAEKTEAREFFLLTVAAEHDFWHMARGEGKMLDWDL
mmetsp:Transcript_16472/g.49177  ORF Transcript_16472/g.49177 Transcript_16472/m.49177 type:complete len:235 (+) Transcript_16472:153-857(+)